MRRVQAMLRNSPSAVWQRQAALLTNSSNGSKHHSSTSLFQNGSTSQTLVLLHGASGNHNIWEPLWPHLKDINVFAPSLSGRCGSDAPPKSLVAEMAQDVLRDIKGANLDITNCVLAGHSMGGAIALEVALSLPPNTLGGLILLTTGARLKVHPDIIELYRQAESDGTAVPVPAFAWEKTTLPETIDAYNSATALTPPATALADWTATNSFDRSKDLSQILCPTTIICGEKDVMTPPKYSAFLRDNIAGSELVTLPGGHFLPVERPSEVAAVLRRVICGPTARL